MPPTTDPQIVAGVTVGTREKLERWLRWYCLLLVLLTIGAWSIAAVTGQRLVIRRTVIFWQHKQITIRFSDLLMYIEKTRHPIGNGDKILAEPPEMNYAAPAILVYSFFGNLPVSPATGLMIVLTIPAIAGATLLFYRMRQSGIRKSTAWLFGVTLLVTSYPLWFSLDRGNIEPVMWILVIVAIWLFLRRRYMSSAILIGIAAAIKIFPICLLVLFLYRAKWKEIGASVLVCLAVIVACFALIGPTLPDAFRAYVYGTQFYSQTIASNYRSEEINIEHSVFPILKQAVRVAMGWPRPYLISAVLEQVYRLYFVFAGIGCLVSVLILRRRPLLNQILGVFVLLVIAPPASYDFTLLYLYIPFALFILYLCRDFASGLAPISPKQIWAILVCFAVAFTPQTFMHIHWTGFGGQFKCLFLLGLLAASFFVPMPASPGTLEAPAS